MNYRKSHFRYTRDQRNGIFYLLLLIIGGQLGYYYWSNQPREQESILDPVLLEKFEAERDSLLALKQQQDSAKIFKYNPNYLDDFRGYQLGLSVVEIDRLLAFRKTGNYINSAKDFKKITGVSDSLMEALRPHLKFSNFTSSKKKVVKKAVQKKDINTARAEDLRQVYGVGAVLSERIVKYRDLLGGFTFEDQLTEVYHLKPETAEKVWEHYKIETVPEIEKLNVNAATLKELMQIVYIDYELAKKILDYRDMVAEIQELKELEKIDGLPVDKLDRIALYLSAK